MGNVAVVPSTRPFISPATSRSVSRIVFRSGVWRRREDAYANMSGSWAASSASSMPCSRISLRTSRSASRRHGQGVSVSRPAVTCPMEASRRMVSPCSLRRFRSSRPSRASRWRLPFTLPRAMSMVFRLVSRPANGASMCRRPASRSRQSSGRLNASSVLGAPLVSPVSSGMGVVIVMSGPCRPLVRSVRPRRMSSGSGASTRWRSMSLSGRASPCAWLPPTHAVSTRRSM